MEPAESVKTHWSPLTAGQVNRRSIAAAADEFGTTVGGRVWRSLIRRLLEMGALFGAITNQIGPLERVQLMQTYHSLECDVFMMFILY